MKKGLAPLAYHRVSRTITTRGQKHMQKKRLADERDLIPQWLVPRRQRMQYDPMYQNRYMGYPMNGQQDGYAMNGYAPPPPGMSCLSGLSTPFSPILRLARTICLSTPPLTIVSSLRPQSRNHTSLSASPGCFETESGSNRLCLNTSSWRSSIAK